MAKILYVYNDQVYANITNKCDCNCTFCIRKQFDGVGDADTLWHKAEPSLSEIIAAIDAFDFTGYKEFVFCGYGEPTCALENLIASARYVKEKTGLPIRVNSNGLGNLYYKRDIVPELAEVVDSISISLNEATAEKISVPTVSVIIPLNNSVCDMGNIKSLLNQSLKNVQYIVLDNGSKGNVGRKLIEDERVVYISNKDWSIGKEVNYALTLVQGEYVLIADTDTYYHYDFLKKNYINARNSNADVTLFKINYYDHINERVRNSEWEKRFHRIPAELNFNFKDLLQDRFNTFSYRVTDKLYKREYLCENNEQLNEEGNGYGDFAFIFSTVINANLIS